MDGDAPDKIQLPWKADRRRDFLGFLRLQDLDPGGGPFKALFNPDVLENHISDRQAAVELCSKGHLDVGLAQPCVSASTLPSP